MSLHGYRRASKIYMCRRLNTNPCSFTLAPFNRPRNDRRRTKTKRREDSAWGRGIAFVWADPNSMKATGASDMSEMKLAWERVKTKSCTVAQGFENCENPSDPTRAILNWAKENQYQELVRSTVHGVVIVDIVTLFNVSILRTRAYLTCLQVLNKESFSFSQSPSVPMGFFAKSLGSKCCILTMVWIFFAPFLLLELDDSTFRPNVTSPCKECSSNHILHRPRMDKRHTASLIL